jgi:hypothetical protein
VFLLAIFLMNPGISMCVGQACVHGVVAEQAAVRFDHGLTVGEWWQVLTEVLLELRSGEWCGFKCQKNRLLRISEFSKCLLRFGLSRKPI